ncbi:hypothetical protein BOW37_12825 [Solemya velum gill symbiont]|nr:hypothetical protein BOW37_12825 [Solemya velum gill symbiont]
MGVPQGSILSVTLFSLKINNIVYSMKTDAEGSHYVDDFSISHPSKYMCTIGKPGVETSGLLPPEFESGSALKFH